MRDQPSRSAHTTPQHPRTVPRPESSVRKVVSVYFHDTERGETHRWPLVRLLVTIECHRPAHTEDPDRSFTVGGRREYLAISTCGPEHFRGQHPLWSEQGKFEGAMMFDDLTFDEVREILEKFYAGRRAEGCFAPFYGRFQFYVPPKDSPG